MINTKRHELYSIDKLYTSEEASDDLLFNNRPKNYGNLVKEEDKRTVFQHDRDAILYSRSFRRLMHKTQVTYPCADKNEHTRTRLTHTLEVIQIARGLSSSLGLNEDLAEAIALGHDLGHTPFGHEEEEFLDRVCYGRENEGTNKPSIHDTYNLPKLHFDFKHNYQSVRVLLKWEGRHYDSEKGKTVPGLNISKQTLEGILKHSKIYRKSGEKKGKLYSYPEIKNIDDEHNFFMLDKAYAAWSVEGQIVALADEIAQVCHDLEDAVAADYSVKQYLYREITQFFNDPNNKEFYDVLRNQYFIYPKKCGDFVEKSKIKVDKDEFHSFISWTIGYLMLTAQHDIKTRMDEYVSEKQHWGQDLYPLDKELASESLTFKNNKYYNF